VLQDSADERLTCLSPIVTRRGRRTSAAVVQRFGDWYKGDDGEVQSLHQTFVLVYGKQGCVRSPGAGSMSDHHKYQVMCAWAPRQSCHNSRAACMLAHD
jgi:hypothetical protein